MNVKPLDIKPSPSNPRSFKKRNLESLDSSLINFGDISGITFNEKTGNLVTGHHRWKILCSNFGIQNINFVKIEGSDKYAIFNKDTNTGFSLRVVNWSSEKESLANVTANSPSVAGQFTDKLHDILSIAKVELPNIYTELNLATIHVDISSSDKPKKKKSETVITASGDTYRTVKLELSPTLADRFHNMIKKLSNDGDSVEMPIELMLDFIDVYGVEQVENTVMENAFSGRKRARKKRK